MDSFTNKLNVKQAVPFFMVTNMERSLQFYIQGLGFNMSIKWEPEGKIEWCWLQIEATAIMLQEYRNNKPVIKLGEGVSICFMCEDALEIYQQISSRGISVAAEPFVGNQLWVVGVSDPDGYNIFFESPTEVMEGTTYSEWRKSVFESNLSVFFNELYKNFNERNIEGVISKMKPDVKWANGMEGGYVYGHEGVREYWTRQFTMMSSQVTPLVVSRNNGEVKVTVHQIVHDLNGNLIADVEVYHIFHLVDEKIAEFHIKGKQD
jgi:lactoylglutathione lyase